MLDLAKAKLNGYTREELASMGKVFSDNAWAWAVISQPRMPTYWASEEEEEWDRYHQHDDYEEEEEEEEEEQ